MDRGIDCIFVCGSDQCLMQIKVTFRYHLSPLGVAAIENLSAPIGVGSRGSCTAGELGTASWGDSGGAPKVISHLGCSVLHCF